ncbi:dihydroxyacetone kinase [Streptomyces violaceusniger]|uniref:Dihydroxyacetone kinase family protein n=2 Tax=Streptomyces violaceusniger group TaxID=2839105 RepID=A0ABD5JBS9_9ACTN|nr:MULTISPECIES: dihydroxyacetone kinase family protein [Streptomyces]KUL64962.1 dihydroxyacetone kinase [Streptomyces violaceusniger]MEE4585832.1 dihydroxyacetone kinase family protein [Streptomyces sp. DSM 41602]RSS46176.1 dihydroxyacetone kinase family protein [Streptomyces sp. WAC05858]
MTRLFNDPARFTDDMITGFAAAHPEHVRAVPGGVVRARPTRTGKVAVLTGGGSGHYPAFCGVVGPGFADGSVIGDVFTSPSAARARSVAEAAEAGGGVLFLFGNYAGDVMNFGLAARQLADGGTPARCFAVTDDIASAPADQTARRRGIAGGFVVFKTASAAAEEGAPLDEVLRVAERTNARTRTLGVAFDGCTLPGSDAPLFTVPEGRLGLGLGIHGEPGVSEDTLGTAEDLARALVTGLLADRPADTDGEGRVAVVLNGLGATKYEELYVLWGAVARRLDEAGLTPVRPEVGELVTSLDMAGCSLTLSWLDDELERLWRAPADTPAFRRGTPREPLVDAAAERPAAAPRRTERSAATASGAAVEVAELAVHALRAARDVLHRDAEALGRLDAVAGDGDHGRGMCKGVDAALAAAEKAHADRLAPAAVLAAAGDAWAAEAGGTSGALWGVALRAIGAALPADRAPGREELASAATAALTAVTSLGGAEVGDKTLVDALAPFATAFATRLRTEDPVAEAYASAVALARTAAEDTAGLRPRLGRARPLADRSVGTPDPGATSLAAVLTAVATLHTTTGSDPV